MPLYDYRCRNCGHRFEKLVRSQPGPGVLECPACGQTTALRQLSTFATAKSDRGGACLPSGGG
jgi:putative FmdB family regulatory protein